MRNSPSAIPDRFEAFRTDIETAFREAREGRADSVLALPSRVLVSHRTPVADLAVTAPGNLLAERTVEAGD
jgi:hypothetical protein